MKEINPKLNNNLFHLLSEISDALEIEKTDTKAIELLEKYGAWVWNKALDWAKDNVKIKKMEELTYGNYDRGSSSSFSVYENDGMYCTTYSINKSSIDEGKIEIS